MLKFSHTKISTFTAHATLKCLLNIDFTDPRTKNIPFFFRSHIVGAPYFFILHKVTNTDDYPSNIASEDDFQDYAQSLGINKDSHVVVYDNSGDGGMYFGGRAWYLFKVLLYYDCMIVINHDTAL